MEGQQQPPSRISDDLVELCVNDLRVDSSYHRPLCLRFLREAGENFNLELFGVLHVNRRADGRFWVIDGHRRFWLALGLLGDGARIPCLVTRQPLSIREEAERFIILNACRRSFTVEEQMEFSRLIAQGGEKAELAQLRLDLNTQRENLSPEDLRRAQLVAGWTDEQVESMVEPFGELPDEGDA
jgi:hypothetical protein